MESIDAVFQTDKDWLTSVNLRDALDIRGVLQYEPDPMRAVSIWANSKFGVAGADSSDISPQTRGFMSHVQDEVHDFLCAPDKYEAERRELIVKGEDGRTAVVAFIAANVSPYLGGGSTIILPVVAVISTIISRIGLRAWCAQQSERRRSQTQGGVDI